MFHTKLYVDESWMNRLGFGLKRFHKIKPGVYTCRCPFCGDSKKSSTKTRFYFYTRKGSLLVQCKNCNYSRSFYNFVYDHAPEYFDEYKKETLLSSFVKKPKDETPIIQNDTKPEFKEPPSILHTLKDTTPCISLDKTHPALIYLYERGLQKKQIERLLYTDNFKFVASQVNPEASKKLLDNEPRIVIPFYASDNSIKLIQGRTLKPSKMKYITIKTHDDVDKIYGLETIDWKQTTYCVEGPLDSLFVDNCLSTCDSSLTKSNANVLIWDNEPRNPEIVKKIGDAIENGYSVVIWPNSPDSKVDINDMIQSGVSQEMLMKVIRKCTYKGLMARLKHKNWKKV